MQFFFYIQSNGSAAVGHISGKELPNQGAFGSSQWQIEGFASEPVVGVPPGYDTVVATAQQLLLYNSQTGGYYVGQIMSGQWQPIKSARELFLAASVAKEKVALRKLVG